MTELVNLCLVLSDEAVQILLELSHSETLSYLTQCLQWKSKERKKKDKITEAVCQSKTADSVQRYSIPVPVCALYG
jgi:hypothetical protein